MSQRDEFQFIIDYITSKTTNFRFKSCRRQLVALWTAYCMHNDLNADTAEYDRALLYLFYNVLTDEQKWTMSCHLVNAFEDMMRQWLV